MEQEMKLVRQIHNEKVDGMAKVLEQWFINKNSSFRGYYRAEEAIICLLNKMLGERKLRLDRILAMLQSTSDQSTDIIQKKLSFKRLMSAVVSIKKSQTESSKFLDRMTHSFFREVADFEKVLLKGIQQIVNIRKEIENGVQKQNIHFRTISHQCLKKSSSSLKEILTLSNLVLRESQRRMSLIKSYKTLTQNSQQREQEIVGSLHQNLDTFTLEFPDYCIEHNMEDVKAQAESFLKCKKQILRVITITDPVEKVQVEVNEDQILSFLSTTEQQMIWSSNVQGLETAFYNEVALRIWFVQLSLEGQQPVPRKIIVTTDGFLLSVDKYRVVQHQLNLKKTSTVQKQPSLVTVFYQKPGLFKIMGTETICTLEFFTEEQCEEFMLHTRKWV